MRQPALPVPLPAEVAAAGRCPGCLRGNVAVRGGGGGGVEGATRVASVAGLPEVAGWTPGAFFFFFFNLEDPARSSAFPSRPHPASGLGAGDKSGVSRAPSRPLGPQPSAHDPLG